MERETFQRVRHLFESVVDLSDAEREARLEALDSRTLADAVRTLLREDDLRVSTLADPLFDGVAKSVGTLSGAPLHPGDTVGNYLARRRLGVGGMAEVWGVQHVTLGSWHALKVLRRASRDLQQRLLREGTAQARLHHPNVVPVRAVLDLHGTPALLMPLVNGPSLGAVLECTTLEEGEGINVFRGIVAGVAHAHARGFVHRDLKPHNVLLEPHHGHLVPRVTDFGLVKQLDGTVATQAGTVMGTPAYAAPELLHDASTADRRADVFSLGVLMVETLTGRLPFAGSSVPEIRSAHGRPPLLHGLDGALATLAERLLAVRPQDRPADAGVVLDELDRLDLHAGPTPPHLLELARQITVPIVDTPSIIDATPMHHVPQPRDAFVGRTAEVEELTSRLAVARPNSGRLVTVVGPGGIGKTRLVQHTAQRLGPPWTQVWWVDLSEAHTEQDILVATATVLGVDSGNGPEQRIRDMLAQQRRCLVILDNLEQVSAHARGLVDGWLRYTEEVVFLGTSRRPLGLAGEGVMALGPLPADEARTLFLDRAHAAGAIIDDERAVGPLTQALDGVPLAIELAAPRARLYDVAGLTEQLTQSLHVLASTHPDRPERQRTLHATLDWSWALSSEEERNVLTWCSVFEGGFTLDAARAVLEPQSPSLLIDDVLAQLLSDSWLVRVPGARPARFRMLRSVRLYAEARLDTEMRRTLWQRHAAHFGATLRQPPTVEERRTWRERIRPDLDNLVAVVRRGPEHGSAPDVAGAALAAADLLTSSGPDELCREVLELALDQPVADRQRAELALFLAEAQSRLEDADAALQTGEAALAIAEGLEPRTARLEARIMVATGAHLVAQMLRHEEGKALIEASLERAVLPQGLRWLGQIEYVHGDRGTSRRYYEEAMSAAQREQDHIEMATTAYMLGYLLRNAGDAAGAIVQLQQAVGQLERLDDTFMTGQCLTQLSHAHRALGQLDVAEQMAQRAIEVLTRYGAPRFVHEARAALAYATETRGGWEDAATQFGDLAALAAERGWHLLAQRETYALVAVRIRQHRFAEAATHLDHLDTLGRAKGIPFLLAAAAIARADLQLHDGAPRDAITTSQRGRSTAEPSRLRLLRGLIEARATLLLEEPDLADALFETVAQDAQREQEWVLRGEALLHRGRARTDVEAAADDIALAAQAFARAGAANLQALALLEHGALLDEPSAREQAVTLLIGCDTPPEAVPLLERVGE